jgi:hypothetical protein
MPIEPKGPIQPSEGDRKKIDRKKFLRQDRQGIDAGRTRGTDAHKKFLEQDRQGIDAGRTRGTDAHKGLEKPKELPEPKDNKSETEGLDHPKLKERKEIEALAENLEQPMREALHQLDYNRIKTFKSTLQSSKDELDKLQIQIRIGLRPSMGEILLATRDAYEGLLDEAERSGAASVLAERQEQLRRVISVFILPEIDFEWASPDEIDGMIKTVRESKPLGEDFGRSELDKLTGTVISEVLEEGELKGLADRPRRRRVRDKHGWLQKWSKVALGAGLAATNLALGGVAVLAYIPTFGQVDLPSALAIAGSVYLGLSDARNSLHQVNASIEDEEDRLE